MAIYKFIFVFFLSICVAQAEEQNSVEVDNDENEVAENILGSGASVSSLPSASKASNGKRIKFLKHPLNESNPDKKNWVKQTYSNMQHVPTVVRENLNSQIYFNKLTSHREPYVDGYFQDGYIYLASCTARLFFDNPYNNRVGRYYFHDPKCKSKVIKLNIDSARRRISSNLQELTVQILLPHRKLEIITEAFELLHEAVVEVVPRNKSELEVVVEDMFDVTPQPNNNLGDFIMGMVEQAVNLAQDTVNLSYLQNEPSKNIVKSVENYENFKRDLKRVIMQLHESSFPPPQEIPKLPTD
jgi:hypothetical protein